MTLSPNILVRRQRPHILHPGLQTAADVNALFGASPTAIWSFDEASGNIIDKVGTEDLAVTGSTRAGKCGVPGVVGLSMSDNTADGAAASVNTYADDDGTTSRAFLQWVLLGAKPSSGSRGICGKKNGTVQYDLRYSSTGTLFVTVHDGTNTAAATAASDYDGLLTTVLWYWDRSSNLVGVHTQLENDTTDMSTVASMANAGILEFGSYGATAAAATYFPAIMWEGAAAETIIDAAATVMAKAVRGI